MTPQAKWLAAMQLVSRECFDLVTELLPVDKDFAAMLFGPYPHLIRFACYKFRRQRLDKSLLRRTFIRDVVSHHYATAAQLFTLSGESRMFRAGLSVAVIPSKTCRVLAGKRHWLWAADILSKQFYLNEAGYLIVQPMALLLTVIIMRLKHEDYDWILDKPFMNFGAINAIVGELSDQDCAHVYFHMMQINIHELPEELLNIYNKRIRSRGEKMLNAHKATALLQLCRNASRRHGISVGLPFTLYNLENIRGDLPICVHNTPGFLSAHNPAAEGCTVYQQQTYKKN